MSPSDEALVVQAQRGDRPAFEELVRRTSRLLYARLYLDTGDRHRAEDLLQETWLRAYRSLRRLNDPGTLRAWLLTIAQNVLTDDARSASRGNTRTVMLHDTGLPLVSLPEAVTLCVPTGNAWVNSGCPCGPWPVWPKSWPTDR